MPDRSHRWHLPLSGAPTGANMAGQPSPTAAPLARTPRRGGLVPIGCALAVLVTGCSWKVGPDYQRPITAIPDKWRFGGRESRDMANVAWWRQLGDPALDRLVESALRKNLDLQIAVANIEQFMGLYGSTRANLFPWIFGSIDYQHRLRSANEFSIAGEDAFTPQTNVQNYGRLSARMLWELDFWGALRRANEAARAELLDQEAFKHAVVLTLASEIAQTYVQLRTLDKNLEITRSVVDTLKEQLRIAKVRFDEGYTSALEVDQVESEYQRRTALIPAVEQSIAETEHALKILLGENPGPVPRGRTLDQLQVPPVPAGLPSDLLARRPDIQQAEQQLIAANARIGVARAEYFPRIILTGDAGTAGVQLAQLFTPGANFWMVGSRLIQPLFTAGRIAGQVQAAEAAQKAAVARYRRSIIAAFREVEDALVGRSKTNEQGRKQASRVEAVQHYVNMAQIRYDEGYTDFITVLDSLRQLYEAQIDLLQAQSANFIASIDLYRAMGGGWMVQAEEAARIPKPAEAAIFP